MEWAAIYMTQAYPRIAKQRGVVPQSMVNASQGGALKGGAGWTQQAAVEGFLLQNKVLTLRAWL